jgi:3-methyl-2-oxobutanoate hydroxymethyltransferase
MADRMTAPLFVAKKAKGEKLTVLTAYDATFAELADEAGVDAILVGDSLGNVVLGYPTTVPVTLVDMVHHLQAVRRGCRRALVIADLPFGTYQTGVSQAVESAVTLMQAGADAVKLEGDYFAEVKAIIRAGIPVMGHLGFTPQSVNTIGGHRVQGRGDAAANVLAQAQSLESAGAFGMVLELIPAQLAASITNQVKIPTIGIGAGIHCDGQVQVINDVLGLGSKKYRHAGEFLSGRSMVVNAIREYQQAVSQGQFPTEENSFE